MRDDADYQKVMLFLETHNSDSQARVIQDYVNSLLTELKSKDIEIQELKKQTDELRELEWKMNSLSK